MSTDLGSADRPALRSPTETDLAVGDLLITTSCWSCGARQSKVVRRRGPRHVSWSCDDCEVTWAEPRQGVPPSESTDTGVA